MRKKDRPLDHIRPFTIESGIMPYAEGSTLVCCGSTRIICSVSIEEKVQPFLTNDARGWITAEYALLPRSTLFRTARAPQLSKGRTHEVQRLIGRSLRAGVKLEALKGYTITVDCDVLQADGGTRTAAVSGGWVALLLAFRKLFNGNIPNGLLRFPLLGAISVGLIGGNPFLDLDYDEDHAATTDMNVVMGSDGSLVEVQATAEGEPFSQQQLGQMLELAQRGIQQVFAIQDAALARAAG